MPAVSQSQFKLMQGICHGNYPDGYRGISKKVACEFVAGETMKGLPKKLAKRHINKKR